MSAFLGRFLHERIALGRNLVGFLLQYRTWGKVLLCCVPLVFS